MRYRVFVGQSTGKGKEKGMSQKEQQALLKDFRSGAFNVMIATCIAEEGLDIPQARSSALGPHSCLRVYWNITIECVFLCLV